MPKYAIIDYSFLIDLQDGCKLCEEIFEFFRRDNYSMALSPTGAIELLDSALQMENGNASEGATAMLGWQGLAQYGGVYAPLDAVDMGIAYEAAQRMIRDKACEEDMINVALIISEAGSIDAKIVLLDDDVRKALNENKIREILDGCHLSTPRIFGRQDLIKLITRL